MEEVVLKIKAEGGQDTEAKVKSIKQQLREAKEAALQAKEGTEEYFQALQKAAGLADQLKDVNEAVNQLDPGGKAAAFGNLINTVAGGFQTITGLYGLLGAKSEDVEKLLLKVQAASAMAMGIQSLVEAQKQWANLSKVVSDFFSNTSKAALSGYAAIILVASAVVLLAKEYLTATDNAIDFQDQLKSANKDAAEQISRVKLLTEIAKDNTQSLTDRKDAIKELNKISPEYLGNLTLENIGTEAAEKATKAYTQALLDNAKAQAASAKIVELQGKVLDGQAAIAAANAKIAGMVNKSGIAYAGLTNFVQEVTKDIKLYEDQMNTLSKIVIANESTVDSTIGRKVPEHIQKAITKTDHLTISFQQYGDKVDEVTVKGIDNVDQLLYAYENYNNAIIAASNEAAAVQIENDRRVAEEKAANVRGGFELAQAAANSLSALNDIIGRKEREGLKQGEALSLETQKKAFKRAQSLALIQTTINGAQAISSILGQYPKFDGGFAMIAALVSATAAIASQYAVIASQKFSPDGGGGGGGVTSSPLQMGGGITAPSIQPPTNTSGLIQEGTDFKVYVVESDITNTQQGVQQNKKKALITI
jgi:hypothetical protein